VSGLGWFALGALAATVVVSRLVPASETNCCQRVAFGARDKIGSLAGPFDTVVTSGLDMLGITKHLPKILDDFGVPLDA
jgi:hypothetical protein